MNSTLSPTFQPGKILKLDFVTNIRYPLQKNTSFPSRQEEAIRYFCPANMFTKNKHYANKNEGGKKSSTASQQMDCINLNFPLMWFSDSFFNTAPLNEYSSWKAKDVSSPLTWRAESIIYYDTTWPRKDSLRTFTHFQHVSTSVDECICSLSSVESPRLGEERKTLVKEHGGFDEWKVWTLKAAPMIAAEIFSFLLSQSICGS